MAAYDDLNAKRIFIVGILSIVVTVVTALAVQVVYFWMAKIQSDQTAAQSDYRRQNQFLQQQQAEISAYGIDPLTGNIVIPVDRAIDAMLSEQESPAETSEAAAETTDTSQETSEST